MTAGPESANDPWTEYIDSALVWAPLEGVHLREGARVLDVGSGDGRITARLRARGFRAIGVELRPGPGADVIARAEALPFRSERFELVLMVLVLMHIPEARQALQEAHRVTRPGGRILVSVGNRRSFTALALREESPRFLGRKVPYDHYRSYTERTLTGALEAVGFRVRSVRCVTYIPRVFGKAPRPLLRGLIPLVRGLEESIARVPLVGKVGVRLVAIAERP